VEFAMEFPFNINAVLLDRITLLHSDTRKKSYMKDVEIAQMVDEMGVASAKVPWQPNKSCPYLVVTRMHTIGSEFKGSYNVI
jgi:hypothetical protein